MTNVRTVQASDGSALQAVQPRAGSVTGSPFTVTSAAAVNTPEMTGFALVLATEPVHARFDGEDATSDQMLLPANQLLGFPVDGDVASFIASSATATVYVELAREH